MKSFLDWIYVFIDKFQKPHVVAFVDEEPEQLKSKTAYLVGEGDHIWYAVFSCPCGCGEKIYTKFVEGSRPRWSYKIHSNKTLSLYPSIWRNVGCKSHFFLQYGKVLWVRGLSYDQPLSFKN